MPPYLPRELGESGALRVSETLLAERSRGGPRHHKTTQAIQEWERQQRADPNVNISARILRQINQQRFDASMRRHHRPARVS